MVADRSTDQIDSMPFNDTGEVRGGMNIPRAKFFRIGKISTPECDPS